MALPGIWFERSSRTKWVIGSLIAAFIGTFAGVASGATLTFTFSGVVTTANPNPYFGLPVASGAQLVGYYVFESTLTPHSDYYYGSYASDYYFLDALSVDVGNVHFGLGPTSPGDWQDTRIVVVNNWPSSGPGDHYQVSGDRYSDYSFSFALVDPLASVFSDTSLPLTPPLLGAFSTKSWSLYAPGENWDRYGTMELVASGYLTSLQVAPVPLPAAAWLFLSGLAGVAPFLVKAKQKKLHH